MAGGGFGAGGGGGGGAGLVGNSVRDAVGHAGGLEVAIAAVEAALKAFKEGEFVLLIDDDDNCCLALAAQHATTERVAFMIRHSAGQVRACADKKCWEGFGFVPAANGLYSSVDFLPGATSGLCAKERAATLKALCDSSNQPAAFSSPGHVFPASCSAKGVLEFARCSEAAVDLCRMAGLPPVATSAEPMREDGSMYTSKDAENFRRAHGLPLLSAQQLWLYRRSQQSPDPSGLESGVGSGPELETESKMWLEEVDAECKIQVYRTSKPKVEIVAIVKGDLNNAEGVPVRVHSECFTGDILASKRCDCGQQLHRFLAVLNSSSRGVLLYIRGHEGRGIGLSNKIRAYRLQDEGLDTVDANVHLGLPVDSRTYDDSLAVIKHLGVRTVCLYTNNPEKMEAMQAITQDVVAIASVPCEQNAKYLSTKKERLNHKTVLETFKLPTPKIDMRGTRIGMVYTTWNSYFVDELVKGAEAELAVTGAKTVKLAVPGACELVSGARALLKQAKPDAIIVFGVLIRGSSDIYDATCSAVMTGLTQLNCMQDTPVVLGVLMCHNEDQAFERSHGPNNPAKAWADTALHMATLAHQLEDPEWARQMSTGIDGGSGGVAGPLSDGTAWSGSRQLGSSPPGSPTRR